MESLLATGGLSLGDETLFAGGYIGFIVPGIIALTAMDGAISGGATLLDERLRGIIKEYLVAPVPRMSILMGNALSTVTRSLFQAVVIAVVGSLLGALPALNPLGWLAALLAVALYALGIAGLALTVAAVVNSTLGYHGLIALNLPLLFASNALYPLALMPSWMQVIARANPTTYAIAGVRRLMYGIGGADDPGAGLSLVVLVAFAAGAMTLASWAFRRDVKKRGGTV